jgi:hypothetical protein
MYCIHFTNWLPEEFLGDSTESSQITLPVETMVEKPTLNFP